MLVLHSSDSGGKTEQGKLLVFFFHFLDIYAESDIIFNIKFNLGIYSKMASVHTFSC